MERDSPLPSVAQNDIGKEAVIASEAKQSRSSNRIMLLALNDMGHESLILSKTNTAVIVS
jgi:hypothetical protein